MPTFASLAGLDEHRNIGYGLAAEARRFAAAIRCITAMLCAVLLLAYEAWDGIGAQFLLGAYALWSGWLLWGEGSGRARPSGLWLYWIDVAWAIALIHLLAGSTTVLLITLVSPVMLVSIGFGARHGVLLALAAALGVLFHGFATPIPVLASQWQGTLPTLLLLGMLPTVALVSRPLRQLRRHLTLAENPAARLDPRRGLESMCAGLAEYLRQEMNADVAALILPSDEDAPAMIAGREDRSFRARIEVHSLLEKHLAQLPGGPVSQIGRHWWDRRPGAVLGADQPASTELGSALAALARTLEVRGLHVVPLNRYERRYGHVVMGYADALAMPQDAAQLVQRVPDLLRDIEQAATVDRLEKETASHEHARIGRDLHDSAIQPYLGLKFAVEAVALRIPPENPARAEVDKLAELVNSQVDALRELIAVLRTGPEQGDNALVPALRRQCRRFAELFGVDVEIDAPERLATTRALATAVFHMVNEVLNNIRKHTLARRVWIALSAESGILRLVFRDDSRRRRGHAHKSFHPASLSERAAQLGGHVRLADADTLNPELIIEIPLHRPEKAAA